MGIRVIIAGVKAYGKLLLVALLLNFSIEVFYQMKQSSRDTPFDALDCC